MNCPDWRALAVAREANPAADPPEWAAGRLHALECRRCRAEALAADPLLLFTRLPERTVAPNEIAGMQAAVAALVRASRVAQGDSGAPLHDGRRAARSSLRPLARFAAVLSVCAGLVLSGAPRPRPVTFEALAATGPSPGGAAEYAATGADSGDGELMHSVVEELDRPGARIYELPQSDMAVVMIVDASLDV